jgi:hypothetical protein
MKKEPAMKMRLLALLALLMLGLTARARALDDTIYGCDARCRASMRPWQGRFYYSAWGRPTPLVVPPTAELQTDYVWGVGGTRVTRIDHQFRRPLPGYYSPAQAGGFLPTPPWTSDTRQLGVYYVRGPW